MDARKIMSTAKTTAQRKRDERQRHRDAGRVAVTVYVRPEWRGKVRELEGGLRKQDHILSLLVGMSPNEWKP